MFNKNMLQAVCLITKSVYNGERRLRWLYRGEPSQNSNYYDSGWEISSELDDDEYASDPNSWILITLEKLIEIEPKADLVLEMPVGTEIMYDFDKDVLINTATEEEIVEPYEPLMYRAFKRNLEIISEIPKDVKMIDELFDSKKFEIIEEKDINFRTGKLVLADPYYYAEAEDIMDVMEETFPARKYGVIISSKDVEGLGRRIYGVKLNITDKKAVKYIELKPEGREWQVVGIDSGLCAIADKSAQEDFKNFYEKWIKENKGKNFYNDYLYQIFEEDYDIGIWKSENTGNNILIVHSGFGDGVYNPLCGYDENGKLANVVIMFIAPEIAEMED